MNRKNKLLSAYITTLFTLIVAAVTTGLALVWQRGVNNASLTILLVSTLSSFFLFVVTYYIWRRKTYIAIEDIVPSFSETIQISERILKRGTITYDIDGTIVYISRWLLESSFKKYLGKDIEDLGLDMHNQGIQTLTLNDSTYQFIFYYKTKTILVLDITIQREFEQYIQKKQPAIILIRKSFSKKIKNDEVLIVKANIEMNEAIETWAEANSAISKVGQTTDQLALIIATWSRVKDEINEEILLKNIKEKLGHLYNEISISIGVSAGSQGFASLYEEANESSIIAINRGGSQTVVSDPEGKICYVGDSRLQGQDDSRAEISIFAESFVAKISTYKEIFITSHKNADIDALASMLAILELGTKLSRQVYAILPELDQYAKSVYNKLSKQIRDLFIKEESAINLKTRRSAIIILDVAFLKRIQTKKFINEIPPESRFIIDHHRVSDNIIESEKQNIFIDTTASSTSQIVYEILDTTNNTNVIDGDLATILLSGIYLDTNVLSRNTSARTHEVISALIKQDADPQKAANLLKSRISDIDIITKMLINSTTIGKRVLFSTVPEFKILGEEEVSLLAEKLLEYKGIDAGFVLARIKKNRYKLSARSNDNFNVQVVAEELKGGGHFNSAAVSWKRDTIEYFELEKKIKAIITKQTRNK